MTLASGTKLGPYEIVEPLGAGGMGEVYRARDMRLDRIVAIKVLPANLSSDPTRKLRFEREAKAVSTLNHPNICSLFDIGSQDGVDFLVMECIDGESLASRLERGPLPLEQVLQVGAEIAGAVGWAHKSNVVHRDIKPGNIMLTKSGAKLLDFGLARPAAATATLATMSVASAQPSAPVTAEGTIVGTFQYMSPEQVEGKELDGRSDIFSLGAVLYEMVTGKRAFEGKSQLSVASAILEKDVPTIREVKPMAPASLDHVIRRCLAKDPDQRWQSGSDLASELRWVGESSSSQSPSGEFPAVGLPGAKSASGAGGWMGWFVAAALAAALAAGAWWWHSSRTVEHAMQFRASLPFAARGIAIAPNGHTTVVVGYKADARKNFLWIYEVGAREATSLPGTDDANFPFWSPDGKSIGFFAAGKLKRVDAAGGPVQVLCDAPSGRGGSWNIDGTILFTPNGQMGTPLNLVPATGGQAKPSSELNYQIETSQRWPTLLPDGKHYLYMSFTIGVRAESKIFLGELGSKEKKYLVSSVGNAAYVEPGYLIFYRDSTLFAQPFSMKTFELSGQPQPVLADVRDFPRIAYAAYAVSNDWTLLAQEGASASLSRLTWFDRKGNETGHVGNPEAFANVSISPDGKSAAVDKTDPLSQYADVWIYDLSSAGIKRLTFDSSIDATPVWGGDGKQIAFSTGKQRVFEMNVKPTDGSSEEKTIGSDLTAEKYPMSWSRDGKYLLHSHGHELWYLTLSTDKSQRFLGGQATFTGGQFSPDGRWVAYTSNESGKWEIYVTSFPDKTGKWQVSIGGGTQPRWRGDGKELFFLSPDGKMMAAPVSSGASFNAGAPVALFQASPREMVATSELASYDVTSDGQKFLINTEDQSENAQPMTLILHWDANLKK